MTTIKNKSELKQLVNLLSEKISISNNNSLATIVIQSINYLNIFQAKIQKPIPDLLDPANINIFGFGTVCQTKMQFEDKRLKEVTTGGFWYVPDQIIYQLN